ncbi:MAG: penicillin-binding protein 2 [Deltaproteobacteria bacterium]|nr:penicillin-binding protein 2 [Deltaproteobacteria bacterium]
MSTSRSPFSEEPEDFKSRPVQLTFVLFLLFLFLLIRLWYLQVIKGPEFRMLSESNRTRVQDILPTRGLILDRHGQILVDNHPAFDLAVVREDVPDFDSLSTRLIRLLKLPPEELQESFDAARSQPAFKPAQIRSDLSRFELVALETHRYELPGIVIQVKPRRKYLHEGLAAHVIGYLGEVNPDQLKLKKYRIYRMGDLIGQYGLEKEHEKFLNGKRGWRLVEVAASGRVLKVIKQVRPVPGHNLYLTLDSRLQHAAEQALQGKAGAIVALDPRTGEIMAMASCPTFSQEDFVRGITPQKWQELVNNPLHPLENRAISGQYMPGSTFKIVAAAAALEEGIITPETTVTCTGGYPFGNRVFRCWRKGGHGRVALHRALVESCDVYFYNIGRHIAIDRLAYYSRALGLGQRTDVGLRNEKPGLVPTRAWKKKRFQTPWYQGENLSVIIGQGYNLVTPLQMARLVAAMVNGGILYRPYLVKRITDAENRVIKIFAPEVVRRLDFKPETLALIKKALCGVVNEPRGTGRRARLKNITVGGKTGTSQVVAMGNSRVKEKDLPYEHRDHAWFVAFAPVKEPRIVLVVIAEHSGHGGSAAAPLANKVLEVFFSKKAKEQIIADSKPPGR